jgi:16S rRNA (cytidine1402-2'-O)-methyltransferase
VAADLPMTCLPGPSAVTTALALSGLPSDRFCFDGFAPRKNAERQRFFEDLRAERRTTIFFESPHRLADTLEIAAQVLGERAAAVCRELTKTYEEVKRGTLPELAKWAADGVKGEITVVLAPAIIEQRHADDPELIAQVNVLVADGVRLKEAAGSVALSAGVSKKELYDAVVAAR